MTNDKKGLLQNVIDVAKASADEIVDRTKAVMSDVAANIGSDPEENAQDRAEAAAARARADGHQARYREPMREIGEQVDGAVTGAKAKAGEYADKARAEAERLKTEAGRVADKAQAGASRAGQDVKDAASRVAQETRETAQEVKREVNNP